MPSPAELEALIRSTQLLIDRDGQDIALWRPGVDISDQAGGFTPAPEPGAPLPLVRRFFSAVTLQPKEDTRMGEVLPVMFVIIGMPDDDMQEGDRFFINSRRYEIDTINYLTDFQVKGEGVYWSGGERS